MKQKHVRKVYSRRLGVTDGILFVGLTLWLLAVVVPFVNVVAISFSTYKEYLERPSMLYPLEPTLENYKNLVKDGRIWIGYRTTLTLEAIGLPLSIFLTVCTGYALSRRFPGRKFFIVFILITMIFQGGIVPLYLVIKELKLINTIWAIVLTTGMNTFYMILMMNYFNSIPDSLMESARLDGAGEWAVLFRIALPLSAPILATITLFFAVDKWNEWYYSKIFIRKNYLQTLQMVLRTIVIESTVSSETSARVFERTFSDGLKMAAVSAVIVPIMCVYPFLQKHFAKGIMVGAVKA